MPRVGFISDPRFVEHDTGPHHPERPDRIRAIARAVREAGLIGSADPFPDFRVDLGPRGDGSAALVELPAPTPVDEKWLQTVHSAGYIDRVRQISRIGGVLDLGDTPVHPGS